jgi:Ca2+-transporting ATPase
VQQSRAQHAVAALQKMSAAKASVVRDGTQQTLPASELVPGDLILIEEGYTVPADARLIEAVALQAAEAALTGESLPVSKDVATVAEEAALGDRTDMVFSGTSITYGRGRAVVTATGTLTEIGRIAQMLEAAPVEPTPLQKELARIGRLLGLVVVGIAGVMIATIIIVEQVHGLAGILDALIFGVALAVAAVPEGLPTVVTAVLSLGVQRMAKRNAIVRHLAAVETLGSANVIASDKTGTLTKNEMTVRTIVTASGRFSVTGTGYAPEGQVLPERTGGNGSAPAIGDGLRTELTRALAVGDRANNAVLQEDAGTWTVQGDPTEGALLVAARKAGLGSEALARRFQRIGEVPFSSDRKLMSTIHTDTEEQARVLVFTKGAPDILLERCAYELVGTEARTLDEARRQNIRQRNQQLAAEALRTLGVAYRMLPAGALEGGVADARLEEGLVFAGLLGMIDPPRAEAKEAVARAKAAGIRPMMITGDHPVTAGVIAAELGVSEDRRVLTGAELEKLGDDALRGALQETSVYARVSPHDKLRLVQGLQQSGAIVAMTGDGVNDAPALRTADIGIAMGIAGTDVSRQAADIVLADDNFATIVAAVEEGRAIFANVRKFLRYLLASNLGEVMTMFFGVLLTRRLGLSGSEHGTLVLPLLAAQVLWINLVTDGGPALALGVDPADPDVMSRSPRPRGEGVITRGMWVEVLLSGAVISAGTLFVLDASLPGGFVAGTGTLGHAQTMAFNTLAFFSIFMAFNARSPERSAFVGLFSNGWLWAAVALAVLLQVAVIYVPFLQQAFSTTPLSAQDWLLCAAVGSSILWLRELSKLFGHRSRPVPHPTPRAA